MVSGAGEDLDRRRRVIRSNWESEEKVRTGIKRSEGCRQNQIEEENSSRIGRGQKQKQSRSDGKTEKKHKEGEQA